jgi:NitT/TauT family transport system ATP-binding protein
MNPEAALIEIAGVGMEFLVPRSGERTLAVSDVSVGIKPGEFLCIVGPSGCGKSTVLNMIAGLIRPTAGRITVNGKPVEGPGPDRGVLFQDYALFPWKTVRENVEFGPRYRADRRISRQEREDRVRRCIELVALTGVENKYPHELSGGMRQRCALARLLANEPDVLLMDEPLAALDAQTRLILQEELLRIWGEEKPAAERKTVVFITHGIDEAIFLADRVVVMSSHPGTIKRIIPVNLPRPRNSETRNATEFQKLADEIWKLIRREAYAATVAPT